MNHLLTNSTNPLKDSDRRRFFFIYSEDKMIVNVMQRTIGGKGIEVEIYSRLVE